MWKLRLDLQRVSEITLNSMIFYHLPKVLKDIKIHQKVVKTNGRTLKRSKSMKGIVTKFIVLNKKRKIPISEKPACLTATVDDCY